MSLPSSGSALQVEVLGNAAQSSEGNKRESLHVATVASREGALAFARRWIRTRNLAFMVARARTVGDGSLWIGQVHTFEGLAPIHSGRWQISRVRHSMTSAGYVCDMDLLRVLEATAEER